MAGDATPPTDTTAPRAPGRQLLSGQVSELRVYDLETGTDTLVLTDPDRVVEAPNWSPDGRWLVVNADGRLWRVAAGGSDSPTLEPVESGPVTRLNNDHVLAPDGSVAYVSNDDGHLYAVPLDDSGHIRRVSNDRGPGFAHYLHGVSPDGALLAYIGLSMDDGVRTTDVWTVPVAGGDDVRLTDGPGQKDGCEWSPDGAWIYYNAELAVVPGDAQVFRMRPDGSGVEQLTHDDRVNWFPHLSPDGTRLLHLSYPPGTEGHPENLPVRLVLAAPDGADPRVLVELFGGQGTTNVNGWAPDSTRFAYCAYPRH